MYWYYIIIAFILFIISLVIIKIKRKDFHLEINKLIQYLGGYENIIDSQINLSRSSIWFAIESDSFPLSSTESLA